MVEKSRWFLYVQITVSAQKLGLIETGMNTKIHSFFHRCDFLFFYVVFDLFQLLCIIRIIEDLALHVFDGGHDGRMVF